MNLSPEQEQMLQHANQLYWSMPDPIYVVGADYRIIWVNAEFERIFGYTAEYLNTHGLEFYPGYSVSEMEEYDERRDYKALISAYSSRYTKDGKRFYVNLNVFPIRNEAGETIGHTAVMKDPYSDEDITLQSEKRYRIVAENTSDTIVMVDNDGIVRYVSPSMKQLSGYEVWEYEGREAFEPIFPEDRHVLREAHQTAVLNRTPVNLEYRIVHKNGDIVFAEARVMPVSDRNGSMEYVVAVVRDITERKKKDHLFQSILDNVNAAVWSSDRDFSRLTLCSESIERLMGMTRSVIEEKPMRMHANVHPDDMHAMHHEIRANLKRGLPADHAVRVVRSDGTYKWVRIIAQPILDEFGATERIDGIMLDITDKKLTELAIEESEQRYKSLFENNLDGVCSIDLNGRFVNANRSFRSIAGAGLEQLIGSPLLELVSAEDSSRFNQVLAEVIGMLAPRDIECRFASHRQDDKIVSMTLVPILLAGRLNGVHAIVKDITERKREERELIRSEERYKQLQQSLNRLSGDLSNAMKVSVLEKRVIDEVADVLPVENVSITEVPRGQSLDSADRMLRWVKISEKEHPVYLKLRTTQPLLRIEEEWLDTAVRYVTILYDNLHLIEDLMNQLEHMVQTKDTPKWMLRLLFQLSEKERVALSSDLHDTVLQDLIIWYRKLESLRSQNSFAATVQDELMRIEEGLLDAIHQIRITCNELRPPFLLKMGLIESVKSLIAYTRMFANYEIEFAADDGVEVRDEDQIIGLYRIVQELLNNASKHSQAAKVTMQLAALSEHVRFVYEDDGVGIDLEAFESSFQHMGLSGIEKRVLSLDGVMDMQSAPNDGLRVTITIPKLPS